MSLHTKANKGNCYKYLTSWISKVVPTYGYTGKSFKKKPCVLHQIYLLLSYSIISRGCCHWTHQQRRRLYCHVQCFKSTAGNICDSIYTNIDDRVYTFITNCLITISVPYGSSGVVVRSTGAYKRLSGHPAGPVLGWVARVEYPVPKRYTCQAVRSGFRGSFSWLSIVVRMRRKIEVLP